jgi:hypothetical protein
MLTAVEVFRKLCGSIQQIGVQKALILKKKYVLFFLNATFFFILFLCSNLGLLYVGHLWDPTLFPFIIKVFGSEVQMNL